MSSDYEMPADVKAVLVWKKFDEHPDDSEFEIKDEEPSPQTFASLELAVELARREIHGDGKMPWIKTRTRVYGPKAIVEMPPYPHDE